MNMLAPKLGTILITIILLILIPTGKAHATPDQLLPHADPKPIPDIANYHIITNPSPYQNPGTPDHNIRFSTPEGYLCTIHVGPHYPYDSSHFYTSCIAHHFPGMPPAGYDPGPNRTEQKLYENILMDNIMLLGDFMEIRKSDFAQHGYLQTYFNELTAFDNGVRTKYPLLQPGNIITYTPPYSTGLYEHNRITPKPASCALGYNHILWCAATAQFDIDEHPLDATKTKPMGFYLTPTKTKWYLGYTDPGRDFG